MEVFSIDELEIVQWGALLHDIGKFYQRAKGSKSIDDKFANLTREDYGFAGAHGKWSATFALNNNFGKDIENLVLYHHEPKNLEGTPLHLLAKIIQKADHHASSERIKVKKDDKNVDDKALISIFSRVNLEGNEKINNYSIPLQKLSLDNYPENFNDYYKKILPVDGNPNLDYLTLWNSFEREFKKLNNINFDTVLALLKKYTSTMPSAAYVSLPDISLYDHSKTTAALASSRFIFNFDGYEKLKNTNDQEVYLIINGEISGIQNFIYRVSSPQDAQSGMSKRLRGRSLYLNLLTDAIASKIVKDLDLNKSNILFSGGGRFFIVAPKTSKVFDKIDEINWKINNWFVRNFNAELYFNLVHKAASGEELSNFGEIIENLNYKSNFNKNHKFFNQITSIFKEEAAVKYEDLCSVCGKPMKKEDTTDFDEKNLSTICGQCKEHEKLGASVANAKFMIKVYSNQYYDFNFYLDELGIGYYFKNYLDTVEFIKESNEKIGNEFESMEIIKLNDTSFLDEEIVKAVNSIDKSDKISLGFNFLGNTVPRHHNNPLFFEHLAQISKGTNKLGIVKMDVDNLGKIFASGLKHLEKEDEEDENGNIIETKGATISRISTLSTQLDMFFSGFINKIAENYRVFSELCPDCKDKLKKIELKLQEDENYNLSSDLDKTSNLSNDLNENNGKFFVYKEFEENVCDSCLKNLIPTIHINYSGGDDLLVLGPYDDIMKFSKEFREKFMEWTCHNPSITLSAGINIVDAKFPIGKAAIMADEFLESSKSCGEDKNKITVFNEVVKWVDKGKPKGYYELLDFAQELENYVNGVKNTPEKISRGFLYTMLNLWQKYFESPELLNNKDDWNKDLNKRCHNKRFVPIFKYKVRAIKGDKISKDELEFIKKFDKKGREFLPWIKIPVSWASLRTRR